MCASCQLPRSDANPPWLVPTGNWAQTGAKQTQEGNMAHGNPHSLLLSLCLSLSLVLIHSSLSYPQFSRQIFVSLQMFGSLSLIQAGSSCSLMTALWSVRWSNAHRGCRVVASRPELGFGPLNGQVYHTLCMFGFYWLTLSVSHLLRFFCELPRRPERKKAEDEFIQQNPGLN